MSTFSRVIIPAGRLGYIIKQEAGYNIIQFEDLPYLCRLPVGSPAAAVVDPPPNGESDGQTIP
jgi:hypothetical protein